MIIIIIIIITSYFPFRGDFRQFGLIWQNSAFKMSQGLGKCPYFVYSKLSFPPLWVSKYLMQKQAGACATHIHGIYEAVQSEKKLYSLLTSELSHLRIIVVKDGASISANLF